MAVTARTVRLIRFKGEYKMKKVIALLLVLCLAFTLVACGGGSTKPDDKSDATPSGGDTTPSGGDSTPSGGDTNVPATPNMNEDGSMNLDRIAHYDKNYDYTQNPQYHMSYMAASADVLYQQSADAYQHWCDQLNLIWDGFVSSQGDSDTFLTNIVTYIDQGTQMLVMDPDITTYPAIYETIKPYVDKGQVVWLSQMGAPRDYEATDHLPNGNLLAPFVGFDYVQGGEVCAQNLLDWLKANYPDVKYDEVGFVSYTFSLSPPLDERRMGAENVWLALDGVEPEKNYFVVDTVSYGMNMQGAIDGMSPVLSTHPDIKYWLVFGLLDDLAMGAASVLGDAGLTETSCTNAIGGAGLQTQLDAGQETAFRYAYALPNALYAEPLIGALYAFINGWCTPDTIWPSWVCPNDCGPDGHTYAQMPLPSWFIDKDNYKAFYSWCDDYTGWVYYGYGEDHSAYDWTPILTVDEAPEGWFDK